MTALTTAEMLTTRKIIGDHIPDTRNSDFDLSETEIQAIWDAQNGHSSEINAYRAYYKMLEVRLGMALGSIDTVSSTGGSSQRQKYLNIKERMADIQAKAGIATATLSVLQGTFDFALDQDNPETGEDLDE